MGEEGAVLQWDERVCIAGHDDGFTELFLDQIAKTERNIQNHFFFGETAYADRPGIFSTVAWIQNNRSDCDSRVRWKGLDDFRISGRGRFYAVAIRGHDFLGCRIFEEVNHKAIRIAEREYLVALDL